MKKSIFKATFEESKVVFDDNFSSFNELTDKTFSSKFIDGKPTSSFKLFNVFYFIGVQILLPLFLVIVSWGSTLGIEDATIKVVTTQLLDLKVYIFLMAVSIFVILFGKRFSQAFLQPYIYCFYYISSLFPLAIEALLLTLQISFTNVSWFMNLMLIVLTIVLLLIIVIWSLSMFSNFIYSDGEHKNIGMKIVEFLGKYATSFLGLAIFARLVLNLFSNKQSEDLETLELVIPGYIMMIFTFGVFFLLGVPYFFRGYYKWKYSEEYRQLNGKTIEEWYGPKYLKKHPELLANPQYHAQE